MTDTPASHPAEGMTIDIEPDEDGNYAVRFPDGVSACWVGGNYAWHGLTPPPRPIAVGDRVRRKEDGVLASVWGVSPTGRIGVAIGGGEFLLPLAGWERVEEA